MFSESPKEQLSPEKNPENRRGSRRGTTKDRKALLLSPAPYTCTGVLHNSCKHKCCFYAPDMGKCVLVRVKFCSQFVFWLHVLKVLEGLERYHDNPNFEI